MNDTGQKLDDYFNRLGEELDDDSVAEDRLPFSNIRRLEEQHVAFMAAAMRFGAHLTPDGGLKRISNRMITTMCAIRIPLNDYQPAKQVVDAAARLTRFHTISSQLVGYGSKTAKTHFSIKSSWMNARHGTGLGCNTLLTLQSYDQQPLTRNLFAVKDAQDSIVAGGIVTPLSDEGGKVVYGDDFYYDDALRTGGWKPGFAVIGMMMAHYQSLGYDYMYTGSWSPQRNHPFFYKMGLADNTQVYHQGQWICARHYREQLKPTL